MRELEDGTRVDADNRKTTKTPTGEPDARKSASPVRREGQGFNPCLPLSLRSKVRLICSFGHLLAHGRHRIPVIEHMVDAVAGKTVEIIRLQKFLVPHFHRVRPALGKQAEKPVEVGDELVDML